MKCLKKGYSESLWKQFPPQTYGRASLINMLSYTMISTGIFSKFFEYIFFSIFH